MGLALLELIELVDLKLWAIFQKINRHLFRLQARIGLRIIHPLEFNLLAVGIVIMALSFSSVGQVKQEDVPLAMELVGNLAWFLIVFVLYHQACKWLVRKYRQHEEENVLSRFFRCYAQTALLKSALLVGLALIFLAQREYQLALAEARTTIFYVLMAYMFYVADELKGGQPPKKRRRRQQQPKVSALEALRQRLFGAIPQVR